LVVLKIGLGQFPAVPEESGKMHCSRCGDGAASMDEFEKLMVVVVALGAEPRHREWQAWTGWMRVFDQCWVNFLLLVLSTIVTGSTDSS